LAQLFNPVSHCVSQKTMQEYGINAAPELARRCSLLLLHGMVEQGHLLKEAGYPMTNQIIKVVLTHTIVSSLLRFLHHSLDQLTSAPKADILMAQFHG